MTEEIKLFSKTLHSLSLSFIPSVSLTPGGTLDEFEPATRDGWDGSWWFCSLGWLGGLTSSKFLCLTTDGLGDSGRDHRSIAILKLEQESNNCKNKRRHS